jgi:NADH dehydrogenase
MSSPVLVVGSTGVLGRAVVGQLLARGIPVRAMARTPEKARDLADLGAEVVAGDLRDPASLRRACSGVAQVVAAAHALPGGHGNSSAKVDDAGHRALIAAAGESGVSRFVYTSALGASPSHPIDFFRTKHAIEEHLKASGLPWVVLRPSAFMEWHAHEFNGKSVLARGKVTLLGSGTRRRNFVAVRDVAAIAVHVLADASIVNRTIAIGGPDNLTDVEVARLYGHVAGVTPKISHVPVPVLRLMGTLLRPLAPGIGRIMRMAALPDAAHPATFDTSQLRAEFPVALTSLEAFVREKVGEPQRSVRG